MSGQKERRRFFSIIIFLGCFSLVALYGAVYLNASIQTLFQSAINEGLTWEGTRQKLSQLSVLSGRVNAPVNDVFVSRDIDTEREYMRKEYLAFLEVLTLLTAQLEARNEETGEQILLYLDDVNANLYSMMSEAEFVFTYLQAGQDSIAAERMAIADQMFREANALFGSADEVVQRVALQRFNEDANSVQQLYALGKFVIMVLTTCFIVFVAVGMRMVKTLNGNQKKLSFSRQILSKTLNSVADTIVGCDAAGRITEWNSQAERLFGSGLHGRSSITELVPGLESLFLEQRLDFGGLEEVQIDKLKAIGEDDFEDANAALSDLQPTVEVDITIVKIHRFDEKHRHAVSYVLTIRDMRELRRNAAIVARSQAKLRLQLFQNDLIRDKLAEQTEVLREAKLKAEASTDAKSRFLAIMSHELRTPMNAILGFSRILQRGDLKKAQVEALNRIVDASNHLLGIINDILDMSKIEAGSLMLEHRQVDFLNELMAIVQTFGDAGSKNGLRFFCYIDPYLPRKLMLDTTRLRQVITNLLGNAFQFTEKGSVRLRVFLVHQQDDQKSEATKHYVRFEVHDSGIGMTQAQQDRVFEPFTQADTSITRKYGGTGLGLTITRQIIESFGGSIELTSRVGEGSCFAFTIPFSPVEAVEEAVETESEVASLPETLSVAILTTDTRFHGWIQYSLSYANIEFVAFSVVDASIVDWRHQQKTQGKIPRIIVDGYCSEYDASNELERIGIEREFLSDCVYLVAMSAVDVNQAEQVYGKVYYMPIFPKQLLHVLHRSEQDLFAPGAEPGSGVFEVPCLSGRQILVVDDVLSNRQYLHELLKTTGCSVTLVNCGLEAIKMCEIRLFDLIFMDIHMPDMNGYDASKAIKAIRYAKKTQIIGLTADAVDTVLVKCLEHGMSSCIGKPFTAHELYAATSFLLNKQSDDVKQIEVDGIGGLIFDDVHIDIQGALDRIDQRTELYHKLIGAFLERAEGLEEKLKGLIDSDASSESDQYLSSIRGTALSVGAVDLGRALSEFEQAVHSGASKQIACDRCIATMHRTVEAMRQVEQRIR